MDPLLWYAIFVVSVTAHEAAHAAAAYAGGDPTAYHGGQVSLNPLPHMRREPLGMVILPLLGAFTAGWPMGWASAPYDPRWEQRHPRRAAWMAIAGPAANLVLAVAAFAALRVGLELGSWSNPAAPGFLQLPVADGGVAALAARALAMGLFMNVVLALLNLIPLPPLDGASAVGLLLPIDFSLRLRASLSHPAASIAVLVAVLLVFPRIVSPVIETVIGWLYAGL